MYLKVALDGGTRPGDTLQILPLALAQPPNPRSVTFHSVLRGHPSLTHRVGFYQGHSVGHSFTKDDNWNCYLFFFFLRKYAIQIKNIKHTHYIYIYKFILFIMCNYYMYAYLFIYIYLYISFIRIYSICVLCA